MSNLRRAQRTVLILAIAPWLLPAQAQDTISLLDASPP